MCEDSHATLQSQLADRDRTIDLLEANAKVQAKLLADTGRRAEELTKALERARVSLNAVAMTTDSVSFHADVEAIDRALSMSLEQSGSGK